MSGSLTGMTPAAASILIVEDDDTTRETFRVILEEQGYCVRTAPSAEDALADLHQHLPAAVLLDLHLPLLNGLEYLRRMRVAAPQRSVPVAVLTGDYFVDESVSDELRSLGATLYFKPVWEADLRAIVTALVQRGAEQCAGE
jgi:two-component system CheB/CheR fusion protein